MPDPASPVSMELPEEIAQLREKVRLLTIQNNARATIIAGHQSMGWDHRAEHLARQQLDSQREANARLTDEVEGLQSRLTTALARVERLEKAVRTTPPDGWVLVPKEPTRAMLDAVSKQVDDFSREHFRLFTRDLWADLLTSASEAPSQGDQR